MLKSFIRTLADALSYHAMNESTELHVYSEDGILKIVLAQDDCENTGVVMNAAELEDAVSSFVQDDAGGYSRRVLANEIELEDDGGALLYGIPDVYKRQAFFFVYIKIHVRKGDLKNGKS